MAAAGTVDLLPFRLVLLYFTERKCVAHGAHHLPTRPTATHTFNTCSRGLYPSKVFGVCATMDILLARSSLPVHAPGVGAASTLGPGHVSFNPKGIGFTVMEPIMKALPNAKHLLMYRDVRKVAGAMSH